MVIICGICGKEVEAEFKPLRPGTSEPSWEVFPCCSPADAAEEVERIAVLKYEIEDAMEKLKDCFAEFFDSEVFDEALLVKANDWVRQIDSLVEEM